MERGRIISKEEMKKICGNYQKHRSNDTRCVQYSAEILSKLLGVKVPKDLIVHFGMLESGQSTVVLQAEKTYVEFGGICPPNCPPDDEDDKA
jgi:hypothetical protein